MGPVPLLTLVEVLLQPLVAFHVANCRLDQTFPPQELMEGSSRIFLDTASQNHFARANILKGLVSLADNDALRNHDYPFLQLPDRLRECLLSSGLP